jgi:hypothetical protein
MQGQQPTFDLLKETVGKRFGKVLTDYGLPALPSGLFSDEQLKFLQEQSDRLPSEAGTLEQMLLENVNKGRVVRTGMAPTGESLFTVRIPLSRTTCMITFAYYLETWRLHSVDAVQTRRAEIGKLLLGALVGSAVTGVLALLFTGVSGGDDIVAQAKEAGYIVLTQEQYAEQTGKSQVEVATENQTSSSEQPKAQAKDQAQTAEQKGAGETVTFRLKEGMTTWDLTSFLKEEGLIKDQMAFSQKLVDNGIDTMLRPQEYQFTRGMTEEEILQALQK